VTSEQEIALTDAMKSKHTRLPDKGSDGSIPLHVDHVGLDFI
jgi:hypothetical protein